MCIRIINFHQEAENQTKPTAEDPALAQLSQGCRPCVCLHPSLPITLGEQYAQTQQQLASTFHTHFELSLSAHVLWGGCILPLKP